MDEIYNRTNSLSLELDEIIDRRNFLLIQYTVIPVIFLDKNPQASIGLYVHWTEPVMQFSHSNHAAV